MVVQIVLDKKLLEAADHAARRNRKNRSELVRDALRDYLRKLEILDKEEREKRGYLKIPQTQEEVFGWEAEATWPPE